MRTWDKSRPPVGPFTLNRDSPQAVGLVAWYPGDGGGLFVPDYIGKTHATTGVAAATTLNPDGAQSLVYSGAQYNEATSSPVTTYPLTIAAWINVPSPSTGQVPFAVCTNGSSRRFQIAVGTSSLARVQCGGDDAAVFEATAGAVSANTDAHIAGRIVNSASRFCALNGVEGSENTGTQAGTITADRVLLGARRNSAGIGGYATGRVWDARIYAPRLVTAAEWKQYIDPGSRYELWYPLRSRKWFTIGAASHAATGALAADAATVAGTASHLTLHTSTGALSADAATVAGTATHLTLHTSTGALAADAATVAGTADHTTPGGTTHTSTGALAADAATVAGTAAHLTLHTSTGALAADSATIAGTAVHLTLHEATGALVADSATMSGEARDETTYVAPSPKGGAGKAKKPRKRRYQVEIDGEVFEVASLDEATEVLERVKADAEKTAAVAIERATKAKRRPVRKVIADAKKALQLPQIAVSSPDLAAIANQMLGAIRADYDSALHAIEIAAHMARRDREIDEDDEEVMLLL